MSFASPSDRELITAMLNGSEAVFRRFFDTYFPRMYRFALPRLGGDVEAAQEVAQATLSRAMRSFASFRGEATLFSWICQICRRQIVDYLRVNKRHSERVVLIDDDPELLAALESIEVPPDDEPFRGYGKAQTRRLVQSVLDRLPARYGDVLEWKYIEGRSVEEIGGLLGVGTVAAQSHLARARTAFRDALETVFGAAVGDVLADIRGE